jgi:hypothetical protein
MVSIEEMILVEDGRGIDRGLILVEDVALAVGLGMEECAAWLTGLHGPCRWLGTDRSRYKSCKGGAYCGAASGSGSGSGTGGDGNGTGAGRVGRLRGAGRVVGILGETCDCT